MEVTEVELAFEERSRHYGRNWIPRETTGLPVCNRTVRVFLMSSNREPIVNDSSWPENINRLFTSDMVLTRIGFLKSSCSVFSLCVCVEGGGESDSTPGGTDCTQ